MLTLKIAEDVTDAPRAAAAKKAAESESESESESDSDDDSSDDSDSDDSSSEEEMTAAHRLYERLGFVRTPSFDWYPVPGLFLRTYALPLVPWCGQCGEALDAEGHAACRRRAALDPPRFCGQCRRRMVVQVTPTDWTARCVEHGTASG